jgi:hypothetical protein
MAPAAISLSACLLLRQEQRTCARLLAAPFRSWKHGAFGFVHFFLLSAAVASKQELLALFNGSRTCRETKLVDFAQ